MIDLTAMGDVINTAHRLQGQAGIGDVIVSDPVFAAMGRPEGWLSRTFELKGKSEPVEACLREHPVT
jgi:adenylate cyclase